MSPSPHAAHHCGQMPSWSHWLPGRLCVKWQKLMRTQVFKNGGENHCIFVTQQTFHMTCCIIKSPRLSPSENLNISGLFDDVLCVCVCCCYYYCYFSITKLKDWPKKKKTIAFPEYQKQTKTTTTKKPSGVCGVSICIFIKQSCTGTQGKFTTTRFSTIMVSEARLFESVPPSSTVIRQDWLSLQLL